MAISIASLMQTTGRHVRDVQHFVDGHAQDVAVHGRDAVQLVIRRQFLDALVDPLAVLQHAAGSVPRRRCASWRPPRACSRTPPGSRRARAGPPGSNPSGTNTGRRPRGPRGVYPCGTSRSQGAASQVGHGLHHARGGARRFGAAVDFLLQAAPARLCFVRDQQHLVDDRHAVAQAIFPAANPSRPGRSAAHVPSAPG